AKRKHCLLPPSCPEHTGAARFARAKTTRPTARDRQRRDPVDDCPSSQGVRGAEWVVGENCKKPGREVKAGPGPSSPLTSVRLWAIIASTGRTFGPGVDPTVFNGQKRG